MYIYIHFFLLSLYLFFIGENLDQFLVPETVDNTVVESPGITNLYTILYCGVYRACVCVCVCGWLDNLCPPR